MTKSTTGVKEANPSFNRMAQIKAQENTDKWGNQGMETLCLCMTEELGELARTILDYCPGDKLGRAEQELLDLTALCNQMYVSIQEERKNA